MRIRLLGFFIFLAGLLFVSVSASAHHAPTMYDMAHTVSVKGVVTNFEWSNPHSLIYVDVKDDKGNIQKWIAETGGPNRLTRAGWTKDSLKPGDQVTLVGHAAKDGTYSMRLEKIVLPDGKELSPRAPWF